MGRPPSHGGPAFRFNPAEVAEMEAILQANNTAVPAREVLDSLANKFSASAERSGKIVVQPKQVWNWFQNRRYALRAKADKTPGKLNLQPVPREDSSIVKNVPQAPQPIPQPPQSVPASTAAVRSVPQAPQPLPAPSGKNGSDNSQEFEAKSARDGAWYDVATFLSHRYLETNDPEVLVRFAGFGPEEDEWVNVKKHVRQRSLPCESSECVAVLPKDLILCFQEGKEQALYFDAHVLDAQRRRHDVRGCRCRFLVRYVHDQSEEIVPLRKVCRRPETDYRLQQLQAANDSASLNQSNQQKASTPHTGSTLRVYPPAEPAQKQQRTAGRVDAVAVTPPPSHVKSVAPDSKVLQPKIAETANVAVNSGNINFPPGIVTAMGAIVTSTTSSVLPVNNTVNAGDINSTSSPINIPAAKATVQNTIVNATGCNVAGNRTNADVSPANVLATNAAANANMASGNIIGNVGNVDIPASNVPAAEATVVDTNVDASMGNIASNMGNVDIPRGDYHATNIAVENTSMDAAPSNGDGGMGNADALLCNLPVTIVDPSNTNTNATLGDATCDMGDVDFRLDNVPEASPAVSKANMDVTSGDASGTGAPVSSTSMDTPPGDAPALSTAASSANITVTSNAADNKGDVNVLLGTFGSMNSSVANANTGGSGENASEG